MRMKKAFKAMLAATACACVLTMPLSIHAAEPTDGLVVDGSLLTHDDSAEVTELFEWRFENSESEVAPLGTYYAKGHAGISKVSSKSVYITATTDCYEKCDEVEAEVNLQRLEGNTWAYVTSRSKTETTKNKNERITNMQKQKLCIPCVGLPSFAVVPGLFCKGSMVASCF